MFGRRDLMKVAIAGASGLIGKALNQYLTSKGHLVTALKRGSGDKVYENFDVTTAANFDAVVNLAGENIAGKRWTSEQKQLILESRKRATTYLAEQIQAAKNPIIFISGSAIGYYGNRGNEILTEDSDAGSGFLAATCVEWEAGAEKARREGVRLVKLRTGVVLSKEGGALNKMLLPFQLGGGGILGSGKQYMSWIAMHDTLRVIEFLLTNNVGGAVNMTAPHPVTNAEFTRVMGKVLHRPTILPAPGFGLKLLLGEMAQEMLLEGSRVLPDKLLKAGFKFELENLETAIEQEIHGAKELQAVV